MLLNLHLVAPEVVAEVFLQRVYSSPGLEALLIWIRCITNTMAGNAS